MIRDLLIGAAIPPALVVLYGIGREIPRAVTQVRFEREIGVPLRFTAMRGWMWWIFVRPGFRLGRHYEPDPSKPYEMRRAS